MKKIVQIVVVSLVVLAGTARAQQHLTPQQGLMALAERAPAECFDSAGTNGTRGFEVTIVSDNEYTFVFDKDTLKLEVTILPYKGISGPEEKTVVTDEGADGSVTGQVPEKEGDDLQPALDKAYQHALEQLASTMESCVRQTVVR